MAADGSAMSTSRLRCCLCRLATKLQAQRLERAHARPRRTSCRADVMRDMKHALEVDFTLAVTVKDTYSRLPLNAEQRSDAVDTMLSALGSVRPADVHEVAFYVLRDACPGGHLVSVVQVQLLPSECYSSHVNVHVTHDVYMADL